VVGVCEAHLSRTGPAQLFGVCAGNAWILSMLTGDLRRRHLVPEVTLIDLGTRQGNKGVTSAIGLWAYGTLDSLHAYSPPTCLFVSVVRAVDLDKKREKTRPG
jgi:hypothetical protein